MVSDRWSVSERWSLWGAAIYGGLVGPPLQVVQSAITDDEPVSVLSENPEYLLGGLIVGSAAFMLASLVRNRVVLRKKGQTDR
jgi:hypothetical protein